MTDSIFKISDVKTLKELAHVLAYPIVAVAYFLQSGPSVGWDDQWRWTIPSDATHTGQLTVFFLYFTLKSIWICSIVGFFDVLLTQLGWKYAELLLVVASVVLLGIGLLGLFAKSSYQLIESINQFWFLACVVWGFACMGRLERIEQTERGNKP